MPLSNPVHRVTEYRNAAAGLETKVACALSPVMVRSGVQPTWWLAMALSEMGVISDARCRRSDRPSNPGFGAV